MTVGTGPAQAASEYTRAGAPVSVPVELAPTEHASWESVSVDPVVRSAVATGRLRVLARAYWPEATDEGAAPPAVPGFIVSSFNPLVIEVAERCLRRVFGEPPAAEPRRAAGVGILLSSAGGDQGTARALAEAVAAGARVPPLLFFQSNPNAVLGHVAARWGLAGPVISLGPAATGRCETPEQTCRLSLTEALTAAAVLIGDGDAREALVLAVEQGTVPGAAGDRAVALYVAGDG